MKIFLVAACLFLGLFGRSASLLEENCGTALRSSRFRRLVGGHEAVSLAHPWMVMVHRDSMYVCGGSLITSRFVLTSAQCLNAGKPMYAHDCCIASPFKDLFLPICLSVTQRLERVQSYTITGWGTKGDNVLARILQETTLLGDDPLLCKSETHYQIDQSQICTSGLNGDSCYGDAGGPLSADLFYNGTKRVFLMGILSFGSFDCKGYSVSTYVPHYRDWIKDTIKQNLN
ncbi:transmembrane protease serine 2-like [Drosophila erecta]|uniref:transmembrane protease serine 2-like n=1 Tax=Drosophila erecta TaxID=7220 RepID=UPI000F0559A1|nr:transmembrane protease serine 2-like [Drosophila erecta]